MLTKLALRNVKGVKIKKTFRKNDQDGVQKIMLVLLKLSKSS